MYPDFSGLSIRDPDISETVLNFFKFHIQCEIRQKFANSNFSSWVKGSNLIHFVTLKKYKRFNKTSS